MPPLSVCQAHASSKMLVMFLCDECLTVVKERLKARNGDIEANEAQTRAVVSSSRKTLRADSLSRSADWPW